MKTFRGLLTTALLIGAFSLVLLYRNSVSNSLWGARGAMEGLLGSAYNYRLFTDLQRENESLKSQLSANAVSNTSKDSLLSAQVYSHYPFNDKNAFTINKGSADGVAVGMPVLSAPGVLLGKVTAIKERISEVTTFFDPAWKSSASIGESHIKAVLQGANMPRLELIPKDAVIKEGDTIKNISPEFPMGLAIGTVSSAKMDEKKVWQIANIEVAYAIEDIDTVLIVTNFP